jgi:hypothetical protein
VIDTRRELIADAFETLAQEAASMTEAEYDARRELLIEARTEPAAPYDLLIARALEGLSS